MRSGSESMLGRRSASSVGKRGIRSTDSSNRLSEVEWRSKYRFSKPITPCNISSTAAEQQIEQCAASFVRWMYRLSIRIAHLSTND